MVKFLDHTPLHLAYLCSASREIKHTDQVVQREVIKRLLNAKKIPEYNLVASEIGWINSGRPFFNLYPVVESAVVKTSLALQPSQIEKSIIHSLRTVCVKLSDQSDVARRFGVRWFFIDLKDCTIVDFDAKSTGKPQPSFSVAYQTADFVYSFVTMWNMCFTEADSFLKKDKETQEEAECRWAIAKIALGVMMLAADFDYIKPVLLKADEGKTTPLEERIERAKRRGVFGFTIGEEIERCPHFRRPHFAIRWTGKGAEIPKLVPVKGAVVGKGKELLTRVPTGYEASAEAVAVKKDALSDSPR